MANEQFLIEQIEQNIRKLIESNKKLKEENRKLHQHIKELNGDIEGLKKELETKRNDLFKITLANTLRLENGVEEHEEKIDDLIKEIDRCIEVLSS